MDSCCAEPDRDLAIAGCAFVRNPKMQRRDQRAPEITAVAVQMVTSSDDGYPALVADDGEVHRGVMAGGTRTANDAGGVTTGARVSGVAVISEREGVVRRVCVTCDARIVKI